MLLNNRKQISKNFVWTFQSTTWFKIKKIIESVSKDYDEKWRQRKKRSGGIGSRFLINFIFQLTLNSQKGYGIILSEMWDDYVAKNIKTPQENSYAISSICEARQKLPEFIFKELNEKILTIYKQNEDYLYKGKHRVFAVDGSKVRLNKELEKEGYKVLNQGAYYPSGLLSCLYEVESGIVHDFSIENNMSERASALEHIKNLQKNDLVVLDRGYFSYLLLKTIEEKKAYSLFRMQQHMMNKEIEGFLKSREEEQVIIYKPSNTVQHDLKKRGHKIDFAPVKLRLLRMKIEEQDYIGSLRLILRSLVNSTVKSIYWAFQCVLYQEVYFSPNIL